MWLFYLMLKLLLSNILAYNLDLSNAIIYTMPERLQGRRNSYFGYATALYTSNGNVSAVLIGAPRANTSYSQSILEPGTVYICPLNKTCKEWIIDKSINKMIQYDSDNGRNQVNQIRNNSWVGAVIVTENSINPRIMVCAPRWINANRNKWLMNGMCYWTKTAGMKSFNKEAEHKIFPTSNNDEQYDIWYGRNMYDHAMGQVGISAHMTSNKLNWNVVMGAPGMFTWTGIPILLKGSNYDNTKIIIPDYKQERLLSLFDYFGYSVTSGCYFKEGEYWFASGSPRGSNMYGYVMVYNFPNFSEEKLQIGALQKGQQYGEYFGAALASCDINNDGKDDLIVGAPLWSKDVDEGRIYIFHTWKNRNMEMQIIEGEFSGGRFGSTITCLGDIDYDGYGDIVVSAPYEKDSGAIYLYNGKKDGVSQKYSQKIIGSQFLENIRGFGISISEPRDINHDNYLDIAVGAYLSEQVILLTSKPVIKITVNLACSVNKLLRDTKFFNISICTSYNGEYAPQKLDIVRILEVDSVYERATYNAIKSDNYTYILPGTLSIATEQCDTFTIHLENNIQNIIDPISLSVVVDLNQTMKEENKKSAKNTSHISSAVINKFYSKTKDSVKLSFVIECGEDNICQSDLQISLLTNLKSNNTYIIGSTSNLELTINVYNKGEAAYQAQLYIIIPDPLLLASIPKTCMESLWINNTLQVICNVGNPLKTNETVTLKLDTSKVHFDVKNLTFYANGTTQSEEQNQIDNSFNMTVYFDIDVDIAIAGKAQEDLYSYFQKDEKDKKYAENIRFQHIYEVQKFGTSPITEAILMVEIPTHWKDNSNDIELISINQTIAHRDGNFVECIDMGHPKILRTSTAEAINKFNMTNISTKSSTKNATKDKLKEKFSIEETAPTNVPPENRTLFINCSNPTILCKQLKCELNSFTSSLSVAKLILTLDLQISNVQLLTMGNKDIVFFASKGTVNITEPPNIIQANTNKPDTTVITTTFLGAPKKEYVAAWILTLSIFFGILLLILIILGLVKLGFFNRKKKEELEALKAMSNRKDPIVLETTSSEVVVLNQE